MFTIGPQRDLLIQVKQGDEIVLVHLTGIVVGASIRGPRTMHALDAEQVADRLKSPSRRKTYDAVCGALVRAYTPAGAERPHTVLWPPRISGLSPDVSRCEVCHDATGRRRPSKYFPPREASA